MKEKILLLLLIITTLLIAPATAQSDREFIDKVRHYNITLIGYWQPVSYTDAVGRQKTDFIFLGNRQEGLLMIAGETLSARSLANDVDIDLAEMELSYATLFTRNEAFSFI